jgi:hypothetical protein
MIYGLTVFDLEYETYCLKSQFVNVEGGLLMMIYLSTMYLYEYTPAPIPHPHTPFILDHFTT